MEEITGHPGYFVTEDGRVFSNKWGKLKERKLTLNSDGYFVVSFSVDGKSVPQRVHRLVAKTYLPNPVNLPEVNHKDENKTNNHINNLEWCNNQYNVEYSHAKWWKIKTPTGETVEVFNLKRFCRENNLHPGHMCSLGKSKGHTLIKM